HAFGPRFRRHPRTDFRSASSQNGPRPHRGLSPRLILQPQSLPRRPRPMTASAQQKKIAARIKALMAKTAENGATEEEALAAMQKARELMDKYGLTMDAIKADAETIDKQSMKRDDYKTFVIKDRLASEVARYCDCKVWMSRSEGTITFF